MKYFLKTCLRVWGFLAAIWWSCQQRGEACSCSCIPVASVCGPPLCLMEQSALMLFGVCTGLPHRFTVSAAEFKLCLCTPPRLATLCPMCVYTCPFNANFVLIPGILYLSCCIITTSVMEGTAGFSCHLLLWSPGVLVKMDVRKHKQNENTNKMLAPDSFPENHFALHVNVHTSAHSISI